MDRNGNHSKLKEVEAGSRSVKNLGCGLPSFIVAGKQFCTQILPAHITLPIMWLRFANADLFVITIKS